MKRLLLLPMLAIPPLALLLWWQVSLVVAPSSLPNGASYVPADCWFEVPASRRIECGWVTTRSDGYERQHRLPVVIVRHSLFRNDTSPVVFIQGGPGGAAGLDPLTMQWWIEDIDSYDLERDFVLYDQRGTGLAEPALRCPEVLEGVTRVLQEALRPEEENERYLASVRACYARLLADGHDFSSYSTHANSDDLADLINLVQPGPWTLYGASYGTRIALEAERRYPALVRDLVLDSVYPHDKDGYLTWPMILGRSIDRVLESRKQEVLAPQLAGLMTRFDTNPQRLRVTRYSGEPFDAVLTGTRLYMALFAATYSTDMVDHLVTVIRDLDAGKTNSMALSELVSYGLELELDDTFSDPVFLSVSCREQQYERVQEYRASVDRFAGHYPLVRKMLLEQSPAEVCGFWKSGRRADGFHARVVTEKPVLLLAGELDAVTPADWAREMHDYLPASRLVIVPGGGHGVTVSDLCTMAIARQFLENPEAPLPATCRGAGQGESAACNCNHMHPYPVPESNSLQENI